MINVECKVKVYKNEAIENIILREDWNDNDKVVLKIGSQSYPVIARDLIEAIKNCTNVNRY